MKSKLLLLPSQVQFLKTMLLTKSILKQSMLSVHAIHFVGRIRKDLDAEKGIHMWVVSDNLLKGAAWNVSSNRRNTSRTWARTSNS